MTKKVKVTVTRLGYRCERCGHQWVPRLADVPKVCPHCKSPYWNVEKRRPVGGIHPKKKQGT